MPGSALQSDFTAGELAPSLSARVDLAKYSKGCRRLENFLVQAHGGAVKRPGFLLLNALPGEAVLVPFTFNQEQAYCLVFGEKWLRVATADGFILNSAGGIYQISSPYTLDQARELSYAQSADVLFLACHGVAPHRLMRYGHADWRFEQMRFTAPLAAPAWMGSTPELVFEPYKLSTQSYLYGRMVGSSVWRINGERVTYPVYDRSGNLLKAANTLYYYANGQASWNNNLPGTLLEVPAYRTVNPQRFINNARNSDGTVSAAQLTTPYTYYVTAINADGKESGLSAGLQITGPASNNWQGGDYISIAWQPVSGAVSYRVYKASFGGRPGFVAETAQTAWNDYNTAPSVTEGAPEYTNPFPANDFPGAVCLFEQRLVFASSPNRPQTIWMSKSGDYTNFASYKPQTADAPLELTIASQEVSAVRWMIALRSLIMGLGDMEWEIAGQGEAAFSASNAKATPQSYWGSSLKRAMIIGNVILHVAASGKQVRSLQYEFAADSYGGMDLSIMAAHLLEKERIIDWTYQKSPDSIVWAVREDGALLGLTFQAEHQISAWHRHTTKGRFKAVCAIPHKHDYALFAVVERSGRFYLERMAERYTGGSPVRAVYLDAALLYEGKPVQTVAGLEHLEGQEVGILADGATVPAQTVKNGRITLSSPAAVVIAGLSYTADLETMPVEIVAQTGSSISLKKQINVVSLLFQHTLGVKAGLSFDALQTIPWRTGEPYGKPPVPFSGLKSVTLPALAENIVTVCVRSEEPLPATLLALVSRVQVHG